MLVLKLKVIKRTIQWRYKNYTLLYKNLKLCRFKQFRIPLLTNSSISLSPRSSLSNLVSDASDAGNSLSKFSRNSNEVSAVSKPKSAGNDVSDISFNPRTVSERS